MDDSSLCTGSTIHLPGAHQNPDNYHLCIVLSDPENAEGRQVLYAPVITARRRYGATCILDIGDHPFIRHKSCVHYAVMGQRPETHLLKLGRMSAPLEAHVLERVLDGVMISPHSPPWAESFLLGS